jgi:hypothetical protein
MSLGVAGRGGTSRNTSERSGTQCDLLQILIFIRPMAAQPNLYGSIGYASIRDQQKTSEKGRAAQLRARRRKHARTTLRPAYSAKPRTGSGSPHHQQRQESTVLFILLVESAVVSLNYSVELLRQGCSAAIAAFWHNPRKPVKGFIHSRRYDQRMIHKLAYA